MFSNRAFSPLEGLCAYQGLLWSDSLYCLWLRCCEQSCALVHICQISQNASKTVFTWNISFILGPFIGNQSLGALLAGNTRICSRANKNNKRKGGRIQGRVEAKANPEGPLYPEQPCVSGFFLKTSSWMGSWTTLPVRYFLHDLAMGEISHNGSQQPRRAKNKQTN